MQKHLTKKQSINLGSFYTPPHLVQIAYDLLARNVPHLGEFNFLDTSCGYGDFFTKDYKYIGADIDKIALQTAKKRNATILHTNSLFHLSRQKFNLTDSQKFIIIGNPPYNDKTSLIRANIKNTKNIKNLKNPKNPLADSSVESSIDSRVDSVAESKNTESHAESFMDSSAESFAEPFSCDLNLKHRDLGISFLRSFALLSPSFVCVLHPLSYLIKRANFSALNDFRKNYKLLDSLVVSSQHFTPKSSTFFPIIIALYAANRGGMDYEFVQNYTFKTIEGKKLRLKDFDIITNYISKYPNPSAKNEAVAYFHTMRDINALKRNKTFIERPNQSSIKVFRENLKHYIYVHFFKQYAAKLPYYFGNLDIFIDNARFLAIADEFEKSFYGLPYDKSAIDSYFKTLFRKYGVNLK